MDGAPTFIRKGGLVETASCLQGFAGIPVLIENSGMKKLTNSLNLYFLRHSLELLLPTTGGCCENLTRADSAESQCDLLEDQAFCACDNPRNSHE